MRTTLTLDDDVMEQLKRLARETDRAFKDVVNEVLRSGLQNMERQPDLPAYRTTPHHMGLQPSDTIHVPVLSPPSPYYLPLDENNQPLSHPVVYGTYHVITPASYFGSSFIEEIPY